MAIGQYAMYTGADQIMQAVDTLWPTEPFYSVWTGKDLMFQWSETDFDKGRDTLRNMLLAAEQQELGQIFTIKFHPKLKSGYITNKTDVIGTIYVRAYDGNTVPEMVSGSTYRGSSGDMPLAAYNLLQSVNGTMGEITKRLAELEAAKVPVEREQDVWDRIGFILDKPGAAEAIGSIITPIIQRFVPGVQLPNIRVSGLNDTPSPEPVKETAPAVPEITEQLDLPQASWDVIDESIEVLAKHCDVVEILPLLANFAKTNTPMFKTIVSQLKSMSNG